LEFPWGRSRPDGSPEAVTETVPLKPSKGTIDTCIAEEVPGAIDGADGVTEMVKEGGGGGGGLEEDPPPQPYRTKESPITSAISRHEEQLALRLSLRFTVDSFWR
jgi:hypothetical protein